jgi:hypothetical protein
VRGALQFTLRRDDLARPDIGTKPALNGKLTPFRLLGPHGGNLEGLGSNACRLATRRYPEQFRVLRTRKIPPFFPGG